MSERKTPPPVPEQQRRRAAQPPPNMHVRERRYDYYEAYPEHRPHPRQVRRRLIRGG